MEIMDSPTHDGSARPDEDGKLGVEKISSIINDLESRLAVGQIVPDIDEAYLLYKCYASAKGFVVRKSKNRYFEKTKDIRLKSFVCNKEGEKEERNVEGKRSSYTRNDIKTGCKAKFEIGREKDSEWKVRHFQIEHNHELALPDETHLLKTAREIKSGTAGVLENMVNSGIRLCDALNYMEQECGGEENMGFTRKDAYNLINAVKNSKIPSGDCRELFRYFQERASKNDCFFWDAESNEFGLLQHFFWRDNRCAIDYEAFGDIVSFDTTYRTNRYNLICAPFVGINHHRQTIMFGCAFLSNETTVAFEWLFKTFLKAMGNKHPQTIITDQCQAMMNAAAIVFPKTRHRLCQWHVKKNAPSHLGSLNTNFEFRNLYKKLMKGCESEAEFENTWNEMVTNHGCDKNSWLNNMYKLRDKWSTAFDENDFNAGLRATSRSESANHVLKEISDKTTSLYNFVIAFEGLVRRWRSREKKEDFNCKQQRPTRVVKHSSLLIHAANVYTNVVYNLFEHELMNGNLANSRRGEYFCGGTMFMFEVVCQNTSRVRNVLFDRATMDVSCSCKKFETTGILCGHALLVLTSENVHEISIRYISRWWTKDVKNRANVIVNGGMRSDNHLNESDMVYSSQIMRFTSELVERSKQCVEAKEILIRCLEQAASSIDKSLGKMNLEEQSPACDEIIIAASSDTVAAVNLSDEIVILDPPVKSKGVSNVRPRSFWEKHNNKKSRSTSEFSRAPKPQANKELQGCHRSTSFNDSLPIISTGREHDTFLALSAPSVLNQTHSPTLFGQQIYAPIQENRSSDMQRNAGRLLIRTSFLMGIAKL